MKPAGTVRLISFAPRRGSLDRRATCYHHATLTSRPRVTCYLRGRHWEFSNGKKIRQEFNLEKI